MSAIEDLKGPDASRYLKASWNVSHTPGYLAWLRCRGGGPRFYLVGRAPHYSITDLDDYGRRKTGPVVGTTAEHRAAISNPSSATA
jgi:hypothetical protein